MTDEVAESAQDGVGDAVVPRKRKWWVKLIALLATLFAAWHIFASFLWIAPYSPLREVVPGNALTKYMLPFFGQSWSVFAPEPINGDYHFNVRALIEEDGEPVVTGWVSATDVELSMIEYNLVTPRAGIQSSEVASNYKGGYDQLGARQKELVAEPYDGEGWEEALRADLLMGPTENDGSDLLGDEADAAQVESYIEQDHMSVAYATQVAKAIWGDDIKSVQFRVSRQNIVPFAQRNDPEAQRPAPQMTESGWRQPFEEPGQNSENFTKTFRAQFERISE